MSARSLATRCLFSLAMGCALFLAGDAIAAEPNDDERPFGIHVVDDATGRGIPLVELRTVNDVVCHTDSAGWVAFREPEAMDCEVYFHIHSPGYEHPADGFGFRGGRWRTTPGETVTVRLKRTQIAQRLMRVTGQGIFRDAAQLQQDVPAALSNVPGLVVGQDSVQAVPHGDGIFWLWGDTNVRNYPLGNFQTTAATSPLPGPETWEVERGVALNYFTDREPNGSVRLRKMMPTDKPGPVWLFGLLSVDDAQGKPTLAAHYSRRKDLGTALEQGLTRFDDEQGVFVKIAELPLDETWRFPRGNAFPARDLETGEEHFYFTEGFATTRVRARWEDVIDPKRYEAFTLDRTAKKYRWQAERPPTTQADEQKLIAAGDVAAADARYGLIDAADGRAVVIHRSSIAWNPWRKRWVMIGNEMSNRGEPSLLGEVWYAEAQSPTGPWRKCVKIATHPRYSFYNPRQHEFLNQDDGRVVHFEGTYTRTFSGNPTATPRYEYNQLLYRLDLSDPRLQAAHTE